MVAGRYYRVALPTEADPRQPGGGSVGHQLTRGFAHGDRLGESHADEILELLGAERDDDLDGFVLDRAQAPMPGSGLRFGGAWRSHGFRCVIGQPAVALKSIGLSR